MKMGELIKEKMEELTCEKCRGRYMVDKNYFVISCPYCNSERLIKYIKEVTLKLSFIYKLYEHSNIELGLKNWRMEGLESQIEVLNALLENKLKELYIDWNECYNEDSEDSII